MADTAAHAGRDPDRVCFIAALRIARRSRAQGAFPPPRNTLNKQKPPGTTPSTGS